MTKKILIALTILFATLFLSSSVFAASTMENGVKDMGTEVKDSWDKLGGAVENVGNNTKTAMNNVGNTIKHSMNMDNNNRDFMTTNNNGYQATKTSATANNANLFGMNSTTWTWFILAIVGALIIALVWYYNTERTQNNRRK